jgi:hypothetical protein
LSKDDFYKPTDIDALRMENELLTFEVCFLKTQLAEAEQLRSRTAKAECAEQDLVLLLRRLANSPLVDSLDSRKGFEFWNSDT